MKKTRLISVIVLLSVLLGNQATAKPELLNRAQLESLFQDRLTFIVRSQRGAVRFRYFSDGTWKAWSRNREYKAWGKWHFEKRKLCRDEAGFSGSWNGLNKKSLCFGLKIDGNQLFAGAKNFPLLLEDEAAIGRLMAGHGRQKQVAGNSGTTALPATSADTSNRNMASANEAERLAAERVKLERMRREIEGEKQRLERDRLALQQSPQSPARTFLDKGNVEFGNYHAVVIGINDYETLPDLKTALADARAVARMLKDQYGYKVHLLENPTRTEMLDKFDILREALNEKDNLLIYYAGHGWLDPQSGRGYWLPVNARSDRRSGWFSNGDLTDALQALFAKHVMVVADSCYSGTLTRSLTVSARIPDYIAHMAKKRTRVVLSSGGLEPVTDSGGGSHSIFAAQFLKALNDNQGVLDGTSLFEHIRKNVVLNADQTPQYSDIRHAGHEGGDFLFVRKHLPN